MIRRRSLEEWHRHPVQVAAVWYGLVIGPPILAGVLTILVGRRLTRRTTS